MDEGEWGNDGTEVEEISSDDEGGNATETEGESGEEDEGGTQIAPQDTEMDAEGLRMMEGEEADDPEASPEEVLPAPSGVYGGGVPRAAAPMDQNEQTPPTQIDSPHADSQAAEDRAPALDPSERRRAPSPPRRSGQGSGVFLSGGVATAVDGGKSSGFLSSAEPLAKATGARTAMSLSSPQQVPPGWLDDQLNAAAAGVAQTEGARAAPSDSARRQHAAQGNGGGRASTHAGAAPVAQPLPKKPSPGKAVAGSGGWIRTKGSPSKGKHAQTAVAEDRSAGAPDTQEGSVAQSIFAIGVPKERRVVASPRRPPLKRTIPGDDGACAVAAHNDGDQEDEDEDEDTEMSVVGGIIQGTVHSQELRPNEFSQIRKGCSQQDHDFERMMDAEIAAAAAAASGQQQEDFGGDETEELASPPRCSRYDGGDVVSSTRKKMKSSACVGAAGRGGGSAKRTRGGGAGEGAIGSRTPGTYVRRPSSKSSNKKRTRAPR